MDIFILCVAVIGLVRGFMGGFFRQVISCIGFVAGLLAAVFWYEKVGALLISHAGVSQNYGNPLAFILLLLLTPFLLSLAAALITKLVEMAQLGFINRLGGACIGGMKYVFLLSCLLNLALWLQVLPPSLTESSRLYEPTRSVSSFVFDVLKERVETVSKDVTDV